MTKKQEVFDIAIIGAGVVGSAIARELARYQVNCALLEAQPDVGMGTSKASTAIWHTGFDAKPGTLEARLLTRGYRLLEEFVPQAGIPNERTGAVLVAWNQDQLNALPQLVAKAHENGVTDVHQLTVEEIYKLEPHINPGALGGLMVPGESIICTYSLPLAFATQAVLNDVSLFLNFEVTTITSTDHQTYIISSADRHIESRYVINAAGLYSDQIDRLFGFNRFTVTPRRGELIVFDKLSRPLVQHVLLPIPTGKTKGVLVSPTVYGNTMVGPTAEDLPDKNQKSTSEEGLAFLWKKGQDIINPLMEEEVTTMYAGLRAATEHSDYQLFPALDQRYICVGGIRSTGISASMGIAEYVAELLRQGGVALPLKTDFKPVQVPPLGEQQERPHRSEAALAQNPDYGRIICHCEKVSLGEIMDALKTPIPATTLEALKRRTRCMQGRCQGFHCQADAVAILAKACGTTTDRIIALEDTHEEI